MAFIVIKLIEIFMIEDKTIDSLMVYYNENHTLKGGKVTGTELNYLYTVLGNAYNRIAEESGEPVECN